MMKKLSSLVRKITIYIPYKDENLGSLLDTGFFLGIYHPADIYNKRSNELLRAISTVVNIK